MDESAPRFDATLARVVAGRYRLDTMIGSGSTGHVFRATRIDSGAVVAIKLLHPHLGADRHATLRFRREAKIAAAVQHPNLVRGIELGLDDDGTWFFAMELLVGRTLAVVMRDEHPLAFPRIHHLFRQTLEAMEAAHARGLVHRDLKPGNVIVIDEDGSESAKVCDFGISKLTDEPTEGDSDTLRAHATTDGAICGTPAYMSPEQARGLPVDARTDIYSATVMLFEMVTGQLPFSGGTKMDVLASHLTELPPAMSSLRADLPAGLEEVVRRGLAKTRETRYATAAEMREALDAVFGGRWAPQPDTVVIPPARPPAPVARRPRAGWWLAATAALAVIGGSWWMRHRHAATVAVAPPPPALAPPAAPALAPAPPGPVAAALVPPPAVAPTTDTPAKHRKRPAAAVPAPTPATPPPPMGAALLDDGERLIAEGRSKEACARGEEALRLQPAAPAALRFLGRCYMRTGRRAEGLASYRRYLEVAPDAPDAPLIRTIVQ